MYQLHVDSDEVFSGIFDDMADFATAKDRDTTIRAFDAKMTKTFKPAVVQEMRNRVITYVISGKFYEADEEKPKPDTPAEALKKQIDYDHLKYNGVASVRKENGFAIVGIKLQDTLLDQEFLLDFKLQELKNGSWQIIRVTNFKDFLEAQDKAREKKLAALNKPLQEKIAAAVAPGAITAQLGAGTPDWLSKTLVMTVPLAVRGNKPLATAAGIIEVCDLQGKILLRQPFETSLWGILNKDTSVTVAADLNPFQPAQAAIMNSNPAALKITCAIRSITYADGTGVTLLKELPNS
jgi:hypothetical protein